MTMITRLTLYPGQRGTKKLLYQYGEDLVCVRYRYDPATKKRYKTAELIVDTKEWQPNWDLYFKPEDTVNIKVEKHETTIMKLLKYLKEETTYIPQKSIWKLEYSKVKALNLEERIVFN